MDLTSPLAKIRWVVRTSGFHLDATRVVAVGTFLDGVDLSKVDEIGFPDLMPGSGHGSGGYVNVAKFEVFGKPVKR